MINYHLSLNSLLKKPFFLFGDLSIPNDSLIRSLHSSVKYLFSYQHNGPYNISFGQIKVFSCRCLLPSMSVIFSFLFLSLSVRIKLFPRCIHIEAHRILSWSIGVANSILAGPAKYSFVGRHSPFSSTYLYPLFSTQWSTRI